MLVYFNHVVLIPKTYKCPKIFFLLLRIFFKVVTEDHSILHVIDEDIAALRYSHSDLCSVLCGCVWRCTDVILVSFFDITLFYF